MGGTGSGLSERLQFPASLCRFQDRKFSSLAGIVEKVKTKFYHESKAYGRLEVISTERLQNAVVLECVGFLGQIVFVSIPDRR